MAAERWELQPDGTWVNGVGHILPHNAFPEPTEGQDAWLVSGGFGCVPVDIEDGVVHIPSITFATVEDDDILDAEFVG